MWLCTKTACTGEAVASCAFSYAERMVWIAPLRSDPDPSFYDLCGEHAETLRVPRGWSLDDTRPKASQPTLLG
jgi:hypothetical protein